MPKKTSKKVTVVHEHPLHVPVSKKNPAGITTRHQHLRHLKGLDANEIEAIFRNHDRPGIIYPTKGKLRDFYKDADKYDKHCNSNVGKMAF